jgi:hypothetical protein
MAFLHEDECVNGDGRGVAKCFKCSKPFCDRCLVFLVNGRPYCEVCGNALLDEMRPRWGLAMAAFVGILALGYLFILGRAKFWGVRPPTFGSLLYGIATVIFAFGGAWRVIDPVRGVAKPRIERRRPEVRLGPPNAW